MSGKATITVATDVEVPMVPNFLRMRLALADPQTIPLAALSNAELRRLGAAWTEALIVRAAEQQRARAQEESSPR